LTLVSWVVLSTNEKSCGITSCGKLVRKMGMGLFKPSPSTWAKATFFIYDGTKKEKIRDSSSIFLDDFDKGWGGGVESGYWVLGLESPGPPFAFSPFACAQARRHKPAERQSRCAVSTPPIYSRLIEGIKRMFKADVSRESFHQLNPDNQLLQTDLSPPFSAGSATLLGRNLHGRARLGTPSLSVSSIRGSSS
jgi:hypothetical protein